MVNTIWAFANANYYSPTLFSNISSHVSKIIDEGSSQALSKTVWSFASSNNHIADVFSQVASRADLLAMEGALKGLAATLWAYAVVGNWEGESANLIGKLWSR